MQSKLGRRMVRIFPPMSTRFAIRVTDGDDVPWIIQIKSNCLTQVDTQGPKPMCTFVMDMETLVEVAGGYRNPQQAYFEFLIEVDGNMEEAMRIALLMEAFFKRHPFCG